MQHSIVEGEPGIFPDPISRLMRKIGGFFDRKQKPREPDAERSSEDQPDSSPSADDSAPPKTGQPAAERPSEDRPGSSRSADDGPPPKTDEA